jgi:hypothetical protein
MRSSRFRGLPHCLSGEGLIASSEARQETIASFDSLASRYDDLFSRSRIGPQRGAVWAVLADIFQPGYAILAVNCRMQDALFLALLDVSVVRHDSAKGMIHADPRQDAMFDGALANFSGLSSVVDWNQAACELASLVNGGAPVVVCVSSRFCLWETLWFVLHGKFRKAFRRSYGVATVRRGDGAVKIRYPTSRKLRMAFSPSFIMRSCTGIGVAVPPSYLEPIFLKYPRVTRFLRLIENAICHVPLLRRMGDHILLHFERV